MEMMILDLGTTVAILAAALAIIPLPDVFIGWFCMLFPAMRSPATRMGDLHASLDSTRNLITRNWPNRNTEGTPNADSFRQWHIEWDTIEREANKLEVLVKGGGWGRYSVAHLWCCGPRMRRLDRKLASVTKRLVAFNKDVFTRLDAVLDPALPPREASVPQEDTRSGPASHERGHSVAEHTSRHSTGGILSALRPHTNSHNLRDARRSPEPSIRSPLMRSERASLVPTEDPELGLRGDPTDDGYSVTNAFIYRERSRISM